MTKTCDLDDAAEAFRVFEQGVPGKLAFVWED